jgi:group I intron endonuclease
MAIIYKITNLINGKLYIGQTSKTLELRFRQHQVAAFTLNLKYPLYRAMRKYGIENFKIELVEEVAPEQVNELERFYIKQYESFAPLGKGYNATRGGEGNILLDYDLIYQLWDEGKSIAEISTVTGANRYGIRGVLKALPTYNETESRVRGNNYQHSLRLKPVYQYSPSGEFIAEFESASAASNALNIPVKSIFAALTYESALAGCCQWSYSKQKALPAITYKARKYKQPVLELDADGNVIARYESAAAAGAATGLNANSIRKACNRSIHKCLDRYFKFEEEVMLNEVENLFS